MAWERYCNRPAADLTTAFLDAIEAYRNLKARYIDDRKESDRNGERPVWFSVPMGDT